jgi:hypothetical protein
VTTPTATAAEQLYCQQLQTLMTDVKTHQPQYIDNSAAYNLGQDAYYTPWDADTLATSKDLETDIPSIEAVGLADLAADCGSVGISVS